MCDAEHMLHCPDTEDSDNGIQIDNEDFDQIVDRIQVNNIQINSVLKRKLNSTVNKKYLSIGG